MKPWYKSRMIYVSLAAGITAILELSMDSIKDTNLSAMALGIMGALQLYLRTVTEKTIR